MAGLTMALVQVHGPPCGTNGRIASETGAHTTFGTGSAGGFGTSTGRTTNGAQFFLYDDEAGHMSSPGPRPQLQ